MISSNKVLLFFTALFFSLPLYAFEMGSWLFTPPEMIKGSLKQSYQEGQKQTIFDSTNILYPIKKTPEEVIVTSAKYSHSKYFFDLYDQQISFGVSRRYSENTQSALLASYGSSSDKPFHNQSLTTFNLTAFYFKENWFYALNYSNNRAIFNNIPLPGIGYIHKTDSLTATFGLPFANVVWKATEKTLVMISAMVPYAYRININYFIIGPVQTYAGADSQMQSYTLKDRPIDDERLYIKSKNLFIGIKSPLSKNIVFDIEAGQTFDREMIYSKALSETPRLSEKMLSENYLKSSLSLLW